MEHSKSAYCIKCGVKIPFNPGFPYCHVCGCACNSGDRYSASENPEMFCHGCGEAVYVTLSNPFCEECAEKYRKKIRAIL